MKVLGLVAAQLSPGEDDQYDVLVEGELTGDRPVPWVCEHFGSGLVNDPG
jgi:hypothetical protein